MPKHGFKHSDEARKKMSESHTGLSFGEAHKANHLKAVRVATSKESYKRKMSQIKTGTTMPVDSLVGAGVNNQYAKKWTLRRHGVEYEFVNLALFVREHRELFDDDDLKPYKSRKDKCRAIVMLKNLFLSYPDGRPKIPSMKWRDWEAVNKEDKD